MIQYTNQAKKVIQDQKASKKRPSDRSVEETKKMLKEHGLSKNARILME